MTQFSRVHGNGDCPRDCLIAQAVAGLTVGMVLVNPSGRVVWLNRTAAGVLGQEDDQSCIGRPIEEVLLDPQLQGFWDEAAHHDGNYMAEVSARWPRALELKVSAVRCRDREGNDLGRGMLVCDVTADRTVQVELSQAVATRLLDLTSGHMPPEPVANLTHQELRILRLVGRGMGNEEIALATHISASTVRSHLKNVYRKLDIGSRSEAVSFAVRNHLV